MHSTGTCTRMYTITYEKATLPVRQPGLNSLQPTSECGLASTWVWLGFIRSELSADTRNLSSTQVQVAVQTCLKKMLVMYSMWLKNHIPLQLTKKIKSPSKEKVASWVSYGLQQLQQKQDMITWSFEACGITSSSTAEIRPAGLIKGQQYSDSENELDNSFLMDDNKMVNNWKSRSILSCWNLFDKYQRKHVVLINNTVYW